MSHDPCIELFNYSFGSSAPTLQWLVIYPSQDKIKIFLHIYFYLLISSFLYPVLLISTILSTNQGSTCSTWKVHLTESSLLEPKILAPKVLALHTVNSGLNPQHMVIQVPLGEIPERRASTKHCLVV